VIRAAPTSIWRVVLPANLILQIPPILGIQDINLAPRNARGMVKYVTNVELLKPADMARGNRILFFEVKNRGNKLAPGSFNAGVMGGVTDRNALSSAGDGWLMRKGYTMV
jgi:hypothetical protein